MADRPLGRPTDAQLARLGQWLAASNALAGAGAPPDAPPPPAYRLPLRSGLTFPDVLDLLTAGARFRRASWPAWKWMMRVTPQDFVWVGYGGEAQKHGFVAFHAVTRQDGALSPYALTTADFDAEDWEEMAG